MMASILQPEIWLPITITPFEGFYEVSNHGRIRALDRTVTEINGKQRFHKGQIITPKQTGKYLGVSLFAKPCSKRFYVHRLVALAFIPNPRNKPCINHKNRNRYDNHVDNLEWVTYQENTDHLAAAGGLAKPPIICGEKAHSAVFTEQQIQELRKSWRPGDSIAKLRQKHGVSSRALYQILRGNTWRHVDPPVAVNWPRAKGS